MIILGIESSCDECSASVVEDGRRIMSNVIATQVDIHRPFYGVVPELASRTHTEWIQPVVERALRDANISLTDIDGIAVTNRPGLVGSLLVGLSFAKALSFGLGIPFVGVNHIDAHLYACHLEASIEYPYIGLIVSGGHTIISVVKDVFTMEVMGTTIDDACGEAFDKIAKHYDFGFPGGKELDRLARLGDANAIRFPSPSLHKGNHRYDVSYSGIKTAAVNQLEQFLVEGYEATPENIAASFERTAIEHLLTRVDRAVEDTGINRIVVGGGVAANTYLRERLSNGACEVFIPRFELCTDNGAMIAGLGYHLLHSDQQSNLSTNARSRVEGLRATYP